jgi:hypothetical protein
MFAALKTKRFNREDTHITNPDKLSTLLGVLALAFAMSVKTGVATARLKPIPLKSHARKAGSLFALGLHTLRKILASASYPQIRTYFQHICSNHMPKKASLSWGF